MPARKPTAKDLTSYRMILVQMRGLITGDISNLERDAFGIDGEKAAVDNKADNGSDSFYQEFSLELLQLDENSLREVDEALDRIDEGSYGRCQGCEDWIAKERLKAVPHARHCIGCQRKLEQEAS